MRRLPTDLQMLNAIYNRYYDAFAAYTDEKPNRGAKIYVPIDIDAIAGEFGVDADLIFGRLYYHLDKKHGYKDDDGSRVPFFTPRVAGDRHCVNFPYLAAVLADLRDENRKFKLATTIAVVSLLVSITSFLISILK